MNARRRGSISAAIIIVLVLLCLAVAGMVLSGAREQDLTMRRLDTVRAFYAAEAGMNMAVREVILNSDADGDGGIGSISNNGVSTDDPQLSTGARVCVTSSASGGTTTLTSKGRSGDSKRQVSAQIQ